MSDAFTPHRLGERPTVPNSQSNVDPERKVGYVPEGQPIPEGMASIPIVLPHPAALRATKDMGELGLMLREALGQAASAIAAVHEFEHQQLPDGGDHAATSEVTESVRMLLLDTYGDDPAILVALLMEMLLWMALAHEDDDDDDETETPTDG